MSDTRPLIQDVLRPGEKIVWIGQPQAWLLVLPLLLPLIFIVAWAAIPFFALLSIFATDPPDDLAAGAGVFLLFPGLFVLVGAAFLLTILRSFIAAWRTHYGLTDHRGIILVDVWPRSVQSYGPGAFAEMTRSGGDDRGTIRFGEPTYGRWRRGSWGQGWSSWPGGRPSFVSIPQPRRVEALIHENLLKNKAPEGARS